MLFEDIYIAIQEFILSKGLQEFTKVNEKDKSIVINLIDKLKERVELTFVLPKDDTGRLIFFIEDIEISDDEENIEESLQYINSVISNDIVMTEEYCKDKLVSRYYEFHQKINGKEEKVKHFSVNKFSFFCKKELKVTRYEPW